MNMTQKKIAGFTLIELAIVLIIFGFIFAPLIAIIVQIDLDRKGRANLQTNDRAVAAINYFLKQNGRYPCPADPTLPPGNANFGAENCAGAIATSNIYIGALPVRALGLPFHTAVNKDHWKHIYAVTQALTVGANFNGQGAITVQYDTNAGAVASNIHFLIVNPGKDGKGAFTLDGIAGPACGTALDSENCDDTDALFRDLALNTDMENITDANFYDDSLAYNHVSEKSDFWVVQQGNAGRVEIINRTQGNIGIGVANPDQKLDVNGGNVLVQSGNVEIQAGLTVGQDLSSNDITVTNTGDNQVKSETFCIGQVDDSGTCCSKTQYDASPAGQCP